MTEYKKPLPVIQTWSKAFWEGTKKRKLLIQECQDCKAKIFYPRRACPECWSSNLGWTESKGKGKVYAFTVTMSDVEPRFAGDLPYVLALIELDEGIRMMGNIIGEDPKDFRIGMNVEVVFEDVTPEITLPKWKPAGA